MWPFAPAIVVVVGALIVAFGSFWQAVRQSNFNAELRTKNEKIIALQSGGNSYFYFETNTPSPAGEPHMMSSNTWIKFVGEYPLHDVQVNIFGPAYFRSFKYDTVRSNQLGKTVLVPLLQFRDDQPIQMFHISINSSNASFYQQIRFVHVDDHWCRATQVSKYGSNQDPLYTWIEPDCFPQGQSAVDWSKS